MYLTGYMNRAAIKGHCIAYFMGVKCAVLPVVKMIFPLCTCESHSLIHKGCANHICLEKARKEASGH